MRVLIVDDIAVNLKLLGAVLEAEGHQVLEALDGTEALTVLEHQEVDAIISDILMPRMDGYRLCYEIRSRERFSHLPFIFYTSSYTSQSDEKLGLEMGADIFLTKPASSTKLLQALDDAKAVTRARFKLADPSHDLSLMKEYNQQLVAKLEQKNAELTIRNAELLLSEQKLLLQGTALETTANAVVITDCQGIILWVNRALTNLTGYSAEEVLGKTPRIFKSGKHDEEYYKSLWTTILSGESWRGNFTNRCKDGSLYYDEHTITPVRSENGGITHFIAIMNDVSAQQEAAEQLQWKTAFFEAQVHSALDGILVVGVNGLKVLQNQRLVDLWNIPVEFANDISDKRQLEWVASRNVDPSAFIEKVAYLYSHPDEISRDELKLVNGKVFERYSAPVLGQDGKYYGRIWTFRDITDRKQAEARIAEQAAFLEEARDAILHCDLKGSVLFWNKGAERIYGWTQEEALGRNIADFIYAEPEMVTKDTKTLVERGEYSYETEHLTKDRRKLTVEVHRTLIRDNLGVPKSGLAIITDITEKKKIEAQFMRAQRMESIGTLASGIAHDLNNIIAPIMMSIEILKTVAETPLTISVIETIAVSAQRGADIVQQVLSFARGLEGKRVELQPRHLLQELGKIIKDTFPKDIRLRFSIPTTIWTILGDPTQVHQILLNLCVNARDAMPSGGTLTVSLENCVLDEQYLAMNIEAKAGRYVKISVTDSGSGISSEILDKIFEPFFTTKELGKGTGLGLSTVLAIVKGHHGTINVSSELEKGTKFEIYLPATDASLEASGAVPETISLPRGKGETVLVVDDEPSILSVTSQTLIAFGYKVLTANNGAEAIAVYVENKREVVVVLTDMMMPVMDGLATIHALVRLDPKLKIIAASGLKSNEGVVQTAGLGVKHFLTKPYTAETLLKTLETVLEEF